MSKEEKVINYYVTCNKLKNIIRTGWKDWNVKRERIESIAEHIYGTQMLAIVMMSEFDYDIDIMKVLYMLAIHELGEIIIGDLTLFQISNEDKKIIEHEAVHKILETLLDGEKIEDLFIEFDAHKTKESLFAYQCDKLECDIQSKIYDEEGCVDLNDEKDNEMMQDPDVQEILQTEDTWSAMWMKFGQRKHPYDDNFKSVLEYTLKNQITKKD